MTSLSAWHAADNPATESSLNCTSACFGFDSSTSTLPFRTPTINRLLNYRSALYPIDRMSTSFQTISPGTITEERTIQTSGQLPKYMFCRSRQSRGGHGVVGSVRIGPILTNTTHWQEKIAPVRQLLRIGKTSTKNELLLPSNQLLSLPSAQALSITKRLASLNRHGH